MSLPHGDGSGMQQGMAEPYSRCLQMQPGLGKGSSAAEAAEEMAFSNRLNIWVATGLWF